MAVVNPQFCNHGVASDRPPPPPPPPPRTRDPQHGRARFLIMSLLLGCGAVGHLCPDRGGCRQDGQGEGALYGRPPFPPGANRTARGRFYSSRDHCNLRDQAIAFG